MTPRPTLTNDYTTMKKCKLLIYLFALTVFSVLHSQANAALKFGTSDQIRFISNTTLTGPNGERLFLARRISQKNFLLPYAMEDKGYILGISGESDRYFPLPEGDRLKAIQLAGYLPRPLPAYEISTLDMIFGHLLWIVLAGLVVYGGYKYAMGRRTNLSTASDTIRHAPAFSDPVAPPSVQIPALPLRLFPSKWKTILYIAISIAFVVIGLMMSRDEPAMGYSCAIFFGLGALILLTKLIPGAFYLEVRKNDFVIVSIFRKSTVAWNDVAGFRVASPNRRKTVGWAYASGYTGQQAGRKIAAVLAGIEGALPDTYGMKAETLARLMNDVRNAQLSTNNEF